MKEASSLKSQKTIRHGFFSRQGGVSRGLYKSLNCGYGSDDRKQDVAANRAIIAGHFGIEPDQLITPRQMHSTTVIQAEAGWTKDNAPEGDAIVTKTRGLAVGVLTADCVPVLLADPCAQIIAAVHAGWRGALAGILEETVAEMERMGAKRHDIIAAIGPAISQKAYQVGEEFKGDFLQKSPENNRFFRYNESQRLHFDLTGFVSDRLHRLDVAAVEGIELCTYGDESVFFSYRRSLHDNEGDYGRQLSAIMVEQ